MSELILKSLFNMSAIELYQLIADEKFFNNLCKTLYDIQTKILSIKPQRSFENISQQEQLLFNKKVITLLHDLCNKELYSLNESFTELLYELNTLKNDSMHWSDLEEESTLPYIALSGAYIQTINHLVVVYTTPHLEPEQK